MQINAEILQKLANIVGDSYIFTDQETRNHYGHDETENYVFPPSVVVKPANAKEISEILKKKAIEKDIYLDDEVINLIASCVKSNVRELEGNLVKLGAYSDLMNVDIDLEIAKKQLNIKGKQIE